MTANRVIGVVSGCGGAGGSAFAAALAACAAQEDAGPAFLLDCDRLGGGIDVLLGCEQAPGPRWQNVRLRGGSLGADTLLATLPRWGDVAFLAADSAAELDPAAVRQVIETAASAATVIVDIPRWPSEVRSSVIALADLTVIVVPAEVRAVTASAVVASFLDPTVSVLAVRGTSRSVSVRRIAGALRLPVVGTIPFDARVGTSSGIELARCRRGLRRTASAVLAAAREDHHRRELLQAAADDAA